MAGSLVTACIAFAAFHNFIHLAWAQEFTNSDGLVFFTGSNGVSFGDPATPTGPYTEPTERVTITQTRRPDDVTSSRSSTLGTETEESRVTTSTEQDYTIITGRETSTRLSGNFSTTATSTSARPVNTQPCNNYVELCERKYSNITEVGCHNSPFVRQNNAASNQHYEVTTQLHDGVRFLQAQMHWIDDQDEPHFCHTSCDLLDAGPISDWLTEVKNWVEEHPFDVITILLGNGGYGDVAYAPAEMYVPWIESTGILNYVYRPSVRPMVLDDWPTLGSMILKGQRVVMFMDYEADPENFPWLLDEFSQMWETPFNPVDREFPCTVQRPPDMEDDKARDRLYLLNHNLNLNYPLFGSDILVPAVVLLNETNAVEGYGSLGVSTQGCVEDWGRAPNILNVDFYDVGNGSVFEVAAQFNNVTYNRECCGRAPNGSARPTIPLRIEVVLLVALLIMIHG
ncbi:hypothetical protein BN1723_001198 [Verticillium longisporum]|uniref:Phosphatidylinositol-specific phospholipase C X domain-containing protein n=1 Tax=Verticillium longisporum TaxID=100787 RepID=A0A0G4NKF5_VERLO|nr:hypothetical protein BN1723_001198 [Verticillium longisporum]